MTAAPTTAGTDAPGLLRARIGVTAIFFANGFAIGAWAVAIPLIKALFALSDATLSLVLFAAGAGAIAAMPIAGFLPPRMGGTGPTLRVSGPIFAALLAALPLTHLLSMGIAPLAISAFLFGVFNILVDVPMNAHASVVEHRCGRAIMSSFHAAWSGGGLVGAAFGGLLISHGASASAQLGVEAAITLAIALTASFQIGAGDARPAGTVFALPERRLIALGAIAFLAVFAEAAVNDWSALYLSADIGMSPGAAAGGFSGYALMMFLGRAFGDGVVHRLGRTRVVAVGALAVCAGIGLAVGLASPIAVVAGFCVVGLGLANMVPAVFSASASAATSPSLGIAMAATLAYASNLIGPPIFGAVASMFSLRVAFAMLLPASLAILALANGQRRRGSS
jgi:predicted MFS family arabinose efflux permease